MIKGYEGSLYGTYRQLRFTDVYESANDFLSDYNSVGVPTTITIDSATVLFYLLYSRYGNSVIASSDINRFKYNLFAIIWQWGPTWEKKVEIQKKLRNLTEEELITGNMQIYNHAENPGTDPSTNTTKELAYINNQNVTKSQKARLEAYAQLYNLLDNDVTQPFLDKFKKLFLTVVEPELPLWYTEEI